MSTPHASSRGALLTLDRAADLLDVTPSWLEAEARAGRLPCIDAGPQRLLFNITALETVLAERAAKEWLTPGADPAVACPPARARRARS
jgi:hypothetical protein